MLPVRESRLAWTVAAALCAAGPTRAIAAPPNAAAADAEALYVRALQAKEEGDVAAAAGLFDQAYRALPADKQASETGQVWVVDEAHGLYVEAYANANAVGLLEADQALLRDFIAAVQAAGDAPGVPATAGAQEALTAVDQLAALHYRAEFGAVVPASDPVQSPATGAGPAPPPHSDAAPQPTRRDGVGLVAVGASMALAGVALTVVGATRVPWGRAIIDDQADPAENDRFIARRELERNILLGLGIPMAVVGGGLLAWGAVRMTTTDCSARLRLIPGPTLTGAGVQVGF